MILNPTKEIIRKYTKKLINSCTQSPNKEIKNPTTTRNKKKQRKFKQLETRKNKENSISTINQHKNQKNMKSKIKLTTLQKLDNISK